MTLVKPETVDLLMEVDKLDMLMEHIDKANHKRTCAYLTSFASYVPEPDDMAVLKIAYQLYCKFNKFSEALRVALRMGNAQYVKTTFAACKDPLEKQQLCYILGRQGISNELDEEMIDNEEQRELLQELISNSKLSEGYLTLARDLDVMEPKTPDDQCNSAPVARIDSSSSVIQELAPQIGPIPKADGDSARDRVRELMVEALAKVWKEAGDDDLEKIKSVDIVQLAVAVENAMFAKLGLSKGKVKAKYRSIMFNIKDENPDFRRCVLVGKVKPEAVCTLTSDEMASDQRKEIENIKAKAMFECERGVQAVASTDKFKCRKCWHDRPPTSRCRPGAPTSP